MIHGRALEVKVFPAALPCASMAARAAIIFEQKINRASPIIPAAAKDIFATVEGSGGLVRINTRPPKPATHMRPPATFPNTKGSCRASDFILSFICLSYFTCP